MGKVLLANAFSLSMLPFERSVLIVEHIDKQKALEILQQGFESAVGHQATADFLSELLGIKIEPNRVQIELKEGNTLVVFQLLQRLPGTVLSEKEIQQVPYKFYLVRARQKHNHLDVADALSW